MILTEMTEFFAGSLDFMKGRVALNSLLEFFVQLYRPINSLKPFII